MSKDRKPPRSTKRSAHRIVELARKYLEPHQPTTYRLNVIEEGVKNSEGWWYVLVQPDREDIKSYDYYGRLAEAEIDMVDKEHVDVLFVPVLPV